MDIDFIDNFYPLPSKWLLWIQTCWFSCNIPVLWLLVPHSLFQNCIIICSWSQRNPNTNSPKTWSCCFSNIMTCDDRGSELWSPSKGFYIFESVHIVHLHLFSLLLFTESDTFLSKNSQGASVIIFKIESTELTAEDDCTVETVVFVCKSADVFIVSTAIYLAMCFRFPKMFF